MRTEDMTPEQLEEAKALQTPEEMLAYARDNGIDLTDEEMDVVAGGGGFWFEDKSKCPSCGSKNIRNFGTNGKFKTCNDCRRIF